MNYPGTELPWFVLGFAFDQRGRVVLIKKDKEWCKDLWNGVGGGVEGTDHYNPRVAMAREFAEETGVMIDPDMWDPVLQLWTETGFPSVINIYRTTMTEALAGAIGSPTSEETAWWSSYKLPPNRMRNLDWVVPMCRLGQIYHGSIREHIGPVSA